MREHCEEERQAALSEQESKLQRQFEWQMREIREEQAHEKRQLLKRAEIDREDLDARCQRVLREADQLRQALAERDQAIEDMAG